MKLVRTVATAVAMSVIAGAALSAPLKLQPANPQPSPKAGLNVKYFGTGNQHKKIRDLSQAKSMLSQAKPGKPLRGLDYRDTSTGENVLTFDEAYNVAVEVTDEHQVQVAAIDPRHGSARLQRDLVPTLDEPEHQLRGGEPPAHRMHLADLGEHARNRSSQILLGLLAFELLEVLSDEFALNEIVADHIQQDDDAQHQQDLVAQRHAETAPLRGHGRG